MKIKKKELIIITTIAATAILLLGSYFVLKTIFPPEDETSRAPTEFVYPNISREDIKDIKVVNEKGEFEVYRIDKKLYFKDAELVPFDDQMFSAFIVNSTYMVVSRKVEDIEDYSLYGLDIEKDNPPYFEINTVDGKYHKVYIGDAIQNEIGYYVRYYDSDIIYVVDGSLGSTHLVEVNDFLLPFVSIQLSTPTQYVNINNFYLSKRQDSEDEKLVGQFQIRTKTSEEKPEDSTDHFPYLIVYPKTHYNASTDAFTEVQATLANLVGNRVVDYGIMPALEEKDPEEYAEYQQRLAKWGLDKPEYELVYNYEDEGFIVYFSKINDEGNRYAYSIKMTSVVEIPASNVDFLEWGLKEYIDRQIFSHNISTVDSITTTIDDKEFVYKLSKNDKDVADRVTANDKDYGIEAFRKYYLTMLRMSIVDYSDAPSEETKPILSYVVEGEMGKLEYKFYRIATRRCYFTINGQGEFYINYDLVKRLIDQTYMIENGEILTDD